MTPSISVIIPAYKARLFLPECLESVARQTHPPAEVLVIDDASPEPVDDIVAEFAVKQGFPPIRLIRHDVNRGQAAARNTGIRASSGDLLAFIDCDDVWAPGHLEQAVNAIEARDLDLAFCPAMIFQHSIEEPTGFVERPMSAAEKAMEPLALLDRCFIIMSSVVAKSGVIRDAGGFDESAQMRAVEDLDLFMKMLRRGQRFGMAEETTLFYRKHAESATGRPAYMAYQSAHVREVHVWHVSGNFFRKCSIVARRWWGAFRILPSGDARKIRALTNALLWSLPVPWETARGILHLCGIRIRRETAPRAADGV